MEFAAGKKNGGGEEEKKATTHLHLSIWIWHIHFLGGGKEKLPSTPPQETTLCEYDTNTAVTSR